MVHFRGGRFKRLERRFGHGGPLSREEAVWEPTRPELVPKQIEFSPTQGTVGWRLEKASETPHASYRRRNPTSASFPSIEKFSLLLRYLRGELLLQGIRHIQKIDLSGDKGASRLQLHVGQHLSYDVPKTNGGLGEGRDGFFHFSI